MIWLLALLLLSCTSPEEPVNKWVPIPSLTAPSYMNRTLGEVQKCINWIPEKADGSFVLVSAPGMSLSGTTGNNLACRGAIYSPRADKAYSVNGNKAYQHAVAGGTPTLLTGTLATSTGNVRIVEGTTRILVLAPGDDGYVINFGSGDIDVVADANFPATPTSAAYMDGYYIVSDGNQFYLSALNDPQDWTPVTFATAEYRGDKIAGLLAVGSNLYIFGGTTLEMWYNTGAADFPFQRMSGAVFNIGLLDEATLQSLGNTVFFVATGDGVRGAVWMMEGATKQKISTPYIESRISAWSFTSGTTLFATAWAWEGHEFYQITNTTSAETFVYDATLGSWIQFASNAINFHRARAILNAFDTTYSAGTTPLPIAFDYANGKVYTVSNAYNQEDGNAVTRTKDFKITAGMSRLFMAGMRIEFEAKHDSSTSYTFSGTLSWSDDNGSNFNTPITLSKAITSGTTAQQIVLQTPPLGSCPTGRIYRLVFAGPAARILIRQGEVLIDQGRN